MTGKPQADPSVTTFPPGACLHSRGTALFHSERPGCFLLLRDHPSPHRQGGGPTENREWALSAQTLFSLQVVLTALQVRDHPFPEAGVTWEPQADVTWQYTAPALFSSGHGIASLLLAAHPVMAGTCAVPQQDLHQ